MKPFACRIILLAGFGLVGALSAVVISEEELEANKPQLAVSKNGNYLKIDWGSQPEVYYFIEVTNDFSSWVPIKLLKDYTGEGELVVEPAIIPPKAFYRLSLEGDPNSARLRADDDGDKIINLDEANKGWDHLTTPISEDTNFNGVPDYWEEFHYQSLDHDGTYIAVAGGLTMAQAYANATDPNSVDSDGDGWTDAQEIAWEWDPNYDQSRDDDKYSPFGDFDSDGVSNLAEALNNSDPTDSGDAPVFTSPFINKGDLGENLPNEKNLSFTLTSEQNGNHAFIVVVGSEEYDEFTGTTSEFNDRIEWTAKVDGVEVMNQTMDVNDLHADWVLAEQNMLAYPDFPADAHQPYIAQVLPLSVELEDTSTMEIICESSVTNIGDGTLPSTVLLQLLKVDLEEVSFLSGSSGNNYHELTKDTDTSFKYEKPHWVDANGDGDADDAGDKNYPVAFTRNSKPKIGAKFELGTDLSSQTIKIKATGPDGIAIPETVATVSGGTVTLPETESTGAFVDTIKHYDHKTSGEEFELVWEMQIGSSGWFSVGATKHTVYLTFAAPSTSLSSRQESLFKIACENSDGIGQPNQGATEITQSIWSVFTGHDVERVDGTPIKYYGNYVSAQSHANTSALLQNADGQCRAWVSLFIDARRVHGLDDTSRHQILPTYAPPLTQDSVGFLIKKWDFEAPEGYNAPYLNIDNAPLIQSASYSWKYAEATDASEGGLAGQNNAHPLSLFDNHVVLKIGTETTFYDPSYGKTYSSNLGEFANGVAAVFAQIEAPLEEARVGESLNDDNGDGVIDNDDDTEDTVTHRQWLFYTNPPGAAFHTIPE